MSFSNPFRSVIPLRMLAQPINSFGLQQQRHLSTYLNERMHLTSKARKRSHLLNKRRPRTFRYQIQPNVIRPVPCTYKVVPRRLRKKYIEDQIRKYAYRPTTLPIKSVKIKSTGRVIENKQSPEIKDPLKSKAQNKKELRGVSTTAKKISNTKPSSTSSTSAKRLTHLTETGSVHMVDISEKKETNRVAEAEATLFFSEPDTLPAIKSASVSKGDVLAVSRIAAIQAVKQTSNLIPLSHPALGITGVEVKVLPFGGHGERLNTSRQLSNPIRIRRNTYRFGGVTIKTKVKCYGKTGIEMEALTAASLGCLTMYDMLKGIDKNMIIFGPQVISKSGGASGNWKWNGTQSQMVKSFRREPTSISKLTKEPKTGPSKGEEIRKDTSGDISTNNASLPKSSKNEGISKDNSKNISSEIEEWNRGLVEEFSIPIQRVDSSPWPRAARRQFALSTFQDNLRRLPSDRVSRLLSNPEGMQGVRKEAKAPADAESNDAATPSPSSPVSPDKSPVSDLSTQVSDAPLGDDIKEWYKGLIRKSSIAIGRFRAPSKDGSKIHSSRAPSVNVRKVHSDRGEEQPTPNKSESSADPGRNDPTTLPTFPSTISTRPVSSVDVLSPRESQATSPRPANSDLARPERSTGSKSKSKTQPTFRRVIHPQTQVLHPMVTRHMVSDKKLRRTVDQQGFETARVQRFAEWIKSR